MCIRDRISTRETVTGLQAQAPVRFRGVDVGKVATIGFDPKVQGNVLVRLDVDHDAPMTTDTYATLSYQGVTGLAFIQLSDDGKGGQKLQPNDEVPPRIPLRPGLLAKLEEKGEKIMEQVEVMTRRVNKVLDDDNQKRVAKALDNIGSAANSADQLAKRLDATVATKLDPVITQANTALRSVQVAADSVDKTATELGKTATRLNGKDGPMDRLSEGSDSFSHAADTFGRSTLPRINRTADEATRTIRSLNRAVSGLTENPQALLYGEGAPRPGPGEPGFQSPEVRR